MHAADKLPVVAGDDMLIEDSQRKHGTTRGAPRRTRTAKASPINRKPAKWRCTHEWDA